MLLSYIFVYICLWIFVFIIILKAKRVRKDDIPIETVYEAPDELSTVLARYIMVAGRLGGRSGEISSIGLQKIMLIELYENGGLVDLNFLPNGSIEYVIDTNYKNKKLKEEQIIFLELLKENVGDKGVLTIFDENANVMSFNEIDKMWFKFWNETLYEICVKRGYFKKGSKSFEIIIGWFTLSITFGLFFAIFALFIPFIGPFIAILLLLPLVIFFYIVNILLLFLFRIFDVSIPSMYLDFIAHPWYIFLLFFSWIVWLFVLGQNMKIALTPMTEKGKEIVRKIKGYKEFLNKVDKDRLSFTRDRDLDFMRNNTTFSWLAIFELLTDKHWEDFNFAHSKDSNKVSVTI